MALLPAIHPTVIARREPNLLVPGKQPVGQIKIDPRIVSYYDPRGSGLGRNLVDGVAATAYSGTPEIQATADGLAIYGSDEIVRVGSFVNLSAGYCITLRAKLSVIDTWGGVFSIPTNGTSNSHVSLQKDSSNDQCVVYHGTSSSHRIAYSQLKPSVLTDGNWHTITLLWKNGLGWCFLDGSLIQTGTHATTPPVSGTNLGIFLFNARDLNVSYGSNGYISAFYILPAVSVAEALEINKNLYRIVAPANDTPYLISVPTGGATVTLSSPTATATGSTTATVGCTVTYT